MTVEPYVVSVKLVGAEDAAKQIARLATGLFLDLAAVLLDGGIGDGLARSDHAVDGTQHSVIRLRLDPVPVDQKIRAALRACGLELERRHDVAPVAQSATLGPSLRPVDYGFTLMGAPPPGYG